MKRFKTFKNKRGSVTVFTALILTAVCVLNCVFLDFGRGISFRTMAYKRVQLACDSILASFDSGLSARYGLYGVNRIRAGAVEETFAGYLDGPNMNGILNMTDFHRVSQEVRLAAPLSDPVVLQEQITAQMEYRTPLRGAAWLLERLGVIEEAEQTGRAALLLAEGNELLIQAEEDMERLDILLDGYFQGDTTCVNGYTKAMWLYTETKPIILGLQALDTENEDEIAKITDAHRELRTLLLIYYDYHSQSVSVIRELQILAEQIRQVIGEAEGIVTSEQAQEATGLTEMVKLLRKQVGKIANVSNFKDLEENIALLLTKIACLDENLQVLSNLMLLTEGGYTVSDFLSNIQVALSTNGIRDNFSVSILGEAAESEVDSVPETEITIPSGETDSFEIETAVYNTLPSVLAKSNTPSYSFLTDFGDVSAIIDLFDKGSLLSGLEQAGKGTWRELLLNDYILCYFSNRMTHEVDAYFQAEMEYVLGGKQSSGENLEIVSNKLMFLRFLLNLVHVLSDSEKHALADEIGRAIAVAVSGGIGGTLYAVLVMCGWAVAESYLDVEKLLEGESVPLVKGSADWQTSIEGLSGGGDLSTGKENQWDLSYTEYLMILLMLEDSDTKLLRIADVIEVNMTWKTGLRYTLSSVYTQVQGRAVYQPTYISFSFFPGFREEDCQIEIDATQSY